MRNKLLVLAVAIATATVMLPSAAANHLSIGATDYVGGGAQEAPNSDARSVVGTTAGDAETPYGLGTLHPDNCYRPDDQVTPGEVVGAATARGFCGQLYYNEDVDVEEIQHVSPPDQHIPGDEFIGTFDVIRTWHESPLFGPDFVLPACIPLCDSTGQDQLWDAVHTAGQTTGFTEGPGDADDGQDGRDQVWFAGLEHAPPLTFAQRNTGVWDMNGYTLPAPVGERFVAVVEEPGGDVFTDDDLQRIVDKQAGSELNAETTAQICGYTPDRNFQGTGTQSFCELPFEFVPADDSAGDVTDRPYDSYDEECRSPAYVCGAVSGDIWLAESVGLASAYAGRYQGDHTRWHHVIAPNPDDCPNTEPGFDFDGDGATLPYLAHDLDVYTTPQDVSGAPNVVSTEQPQRYAETVAANLFPLPGLPGPAEGAADQAEDALTPVTRGETIEPNNADTISGLEENSRIAIDVQRGVDDSCTQLIADEKLADSWVNILDATVDAHRQASYRDPVVDTRTPPELATDTPHVGLYGSDESQDASNEATPGLYSTEGKAGVFTDRDDDGEYESVTGPADSASTFGAGVYGEKNIQREGAYPMLWDMHASLDDNGNPAIDTDESCGFTGDQNFTEVMQDAGYGPNTGLAQAIYLKEPTVFTNARVVPNDGPSTAGPPTDPGSVPYPAGNNIYLLLNDAARNLWDGSVSSSNGLALDERVDDLVTELRAHVVANYDVPGEPAVEQPGTELGLESDFLSQCGESTGGFASQLSFLHTCEVDCSGDTIATMYTFEATTPKIGGGDIPTLKIQGDEYTFGEFQHTWIDVDPFDGDADRNEQKKAPPPSS